MLPFLNVAFLIVHTVVLVFNVTGWAWSRTRRLHAISLAATLFSWIVLGAWYGWGYCVCTDWHWRVRRAMGIVDPPGSYTRFLLRALTGITLSQVAMDWITGSAVGVAVVMNVALTVRDTRRRRRGPVSAGHLAGFGRRSAK